MVSWRWALRALRIAGGGGYDGYPLLNGGTAGLILGVFRVDSKPRRPDTISPARFRGARRYGATDVASEAVPPRRLHR